MLLCCISYRTCVLRMLVMLTELTACCRMFLARVMLLTIVGLTHIYEIWNSLPGVQPTLVLPWVESTSQHYGLLISNQFYITFTFFRKSPQWFTENSAYQEISRIKRVTYNYLRQIGPIRMCATLQSAQNALVLAQSQQVC